MARSLNIANDKGRDAIVSAETLRKPLRVRWLDPRGRQVQPVRLLKSTIDRDYDALLAAHIAPDALAKALIAGDPELDLERCGSYLRETARVYVDADKRVVHSVDELEIVRAPDGSEKERRQKVATHPNTGIETPLKWSGRLVPKKDAVRRFVFVQSQQIVHVNGLTYDFLFAMAKELEAAQSLLLLGAGPKGNQPLVFQRSGTPFRGFLEGRTEGDKYALVLHLTNLELKRPEVAESGVVAESAGDADKEGGS